MSVEDRLAIQDLLATYADIVDSRSFDRLGEVFTEDATIDFGAFGGSFGGIAETRAFLESTLPMFRRTQHLMGLPVIRINGDTATARTPCHNPMVMPSDDGSASVWLIGLWYDDELVRTGAGWRIRRRSQDRASFVTGLTDA